YNPFHNGHLYHLQKAQELTGASNSIAVMGGHFLQRGEPAIFNKWSRTRMALSAGIDLVIELPFIFASQDARGFAHAGVSLLDSLGIVDYITFGCENDQIDDLSKIANLLKKEPTYFQQILKEGVKKGNSFPKIREKAISNYFQKYGREFKNISPKKVIQIMNQSNNILALEYLISLKKLNSPMKPLPVKRVGSKYIQNKLEGHYSSATAIRKEIVKEYLMKEPSLFKNLELTIPLSSYQIISNEFKTGLNPITLSCFEQAFLYYLRRMEINNIKEIHGIQEGLENRLKRSAISANSIENLIQSIKTKRYTRTRIQRLLIHGLFNLTKKEVLNFNKRGPLYCRILGMTEKGKFLLRDIKTKSKIPIVIKLNNFYQHNMINNNDTILKMLDYDILATDLYVLGYQKKEFRVGGLDYTRKIEILTTQYF
ncbi:MAG: nucleotidyltransferase, partial [Atribacterota bacterium]